MYCYCNKIENGSCGLNLYMIGIFEVEMIKVAKVKITCIVGPPYLLCVGSASQIHSYLQISIENIFKNSRKFLKQTLNLPLAQATIYIALTLYSVL